MLAASVPAQRPAGAKLLAIDSAGNLRHLPRTAFLDLLRPGDLVVANDAATLPASLAGDGIEVRLAGRRSLAPDDVQHFSAIVFGPGDFHTRTEDRPSPPRFEPGDRLVLGPLHATVEAVLQHPRFLALRFDGSPDEIRESLARHGRPIQYAHVPEPLALWDVWTPIAGPPVAFEPPSAGFVLDWKLLAKMMARGIRFATITHAAGISSTGDPALDALLPFDEPYRIPASTARAIERTRMQGRRVVAIGTTVVRALEHAAGRAGEGVANQRIGASTDLRVIDAILSGTHEQGTSHYELLRAFASAETLSRADRELNSFQYQTHEFGDSVFVERARDPVSWKATPCAAVCYSC